jgi:hypothetical protein
MTDGTYRMSDGDVVSRLLEGANFWNAYMLGNPAAKYDFSDADLSELRSLAGYQFTGLADFSGAKFKELHLGQAAFNGGACFDRISVEAIIATRLAMTPLQSPSEAHNFETLLR